MTSHRRMLSVLLTFVLAASCSSTSTVSQPIAAATADPVAATTEPAPTVAPSATAPPPIATPTATPTTAPTAVSTPSRPDAASAPDHVRTGLDVLVESDLVSLHGKRVGVIANQTSQTSDGRHVIDVLHEHPLVELVAVFAPEHGVRGLAGAGEEVGDTIDEATGTPIRSLYGTTRTPLPDDLAAIDVLVYDLQDVGARFYTYISTMGLAMAAAHDAGVEFMVLDRPNPLGGDYVAGFVRTSDQVSFISQYPVPAVYGMTAGELATMIAGEAWVDERVLTAPTIIELNGWDRSKRWQDLDRPWVTPSPALPTADAALVYAGTVLFEATSLDYGRGTDAPFTRISAPWIDSPALVADLQSRNLPGASFEAAADAPGVEILVDDASALAPLELGVYVLVAVRNHALVQGQPNIIDRAPTFDLLAGTTQMRTMIDAGSAPAEIIASWQDEIAAFRAIRSAYLRY